MRVVCEGCVRLRWDALVRLTTSTRVAIFLAQARVPGGDRGGRSISLLAMKVILPRTASSSFLRQVDHAEQPWSGPGFYTENVELVLLSAFKKEIECW